MLLDALERRICQRWWRYCSLWCSGTVSTECMLWCSDMFCGSLLSALTRCVARWNTFHMKLTQRCRKRTRARRNPAFSSFLEIDVAICRSVVTCHCNASELLRKLHHCNEGWICWETTKVVVIAMITLTKQKDLQKIRKADKSRCFVCARIRLQVALIRHCFDLSWGTCGQLGAMPHRPVHGHDMYFPKPCFTANLHILQILLIWARFGGDLPNGKGA